MIRVTIELLRGGFGRPVRLGEMIIANDNTGTERLGNYNARLIAANGKSYRRSRVTGYRRLEEGPWQLVRMALEKLCRR